MERSLQIVFNQLRIYFERLGRSHFLLLVKILSSVFAKIFSNCVFLLKYSVVVCDCEIIQ